MGIHSPAKTSAMTLPQRSLKTRFWINTLVGRWYYLSFWWETRITLFPTNALVARRVLIAERQITSLFKPRKISSEQFMLISEGFKGRILLLHRKALKQPEKIRKQIFNIDLERSGGREAFALKCYYDEILMSCLSQKIIYISSLTKTVT